MLKKKTVKVLMIIILVFLLLAVSYFIRLAFGSYTTHSFNNYLNDKYYSDFYAEKFMPQLDSLNDYEDIDFTYYRKNHSNALTANAYTLSVKYSKENYTNSKDNIIDNFSITNEELHFNNSDIWRCYYPDSDYPMNFGMIGFNDEDSIISYLFFFDEGNTNNDINWILSEYFSEI